MVGPGSLLLSLRSVPDSHPARFIYSTSYSNSSSILPGGWVCRGLYQRRGLILSRWKHYASNAGGGQNNSEVCHGILMTPVVDRHLLWVYSIFNIMNIVDPMDGYQLQSDLLKALSHPTRLAVLEILRDGEQCVCHMEARLNQRQAYISQQLMILKQAGLVETRRDGLNLYYHVVKPEIYSVLDRLPSVTGVSPKPIKHKRSKMACPCPKCNAV
jgi:DNA-binding transcriptional ArsR family regulator